MDDRVITFRPKTANCTEYCEDDKSATLTLGYHYGDGGDAALILVNKADAIALEGNGARPSHQGSGYAEDGKMFTLNTIERHAVCYRKSTKSAKDGNGDKWIQDRVTNTINTFENTDVRTAEIILEVRE